MTIGVFRHRQIPVLPDHPTVIVRWLNKLTVGPLGAPVDVDWLAEIRAFQKVLDRRRIKRVLKRTQRGIQVRY